MISRHDAADSVWGIPSSRGTMAPMSTTRHFEINWFAAAGSALGAVSSAVLLSTLGAAGTLIGAALGSLVITVGGSIYTQSLQKTKAQVDLRRGVARSGRPGTAASSAADEPRTGSTSVRPPKPPAAPLGDTLRSLPWKRIAWLAVGLFVAAMAVILVFELSTGRPVSSYTGGSNETRKGTTFSGLQPSGDTSSDSESPAPTSTPTLGEAPSSSAPPVDVQPTKEQPTGKPTVGENPVEPPAPVDPPAEAPAPVDPPAPVEPPVEPQPTDG